MWEIFIKFLLVMLRCITRKLSFFYIEKTNYAYNVTSLQFIIYQQNYGKILGNKVNKTITDILCKLILQNFRCTDNRKPYIAVHRTYIILISFVRNVGVHQFVVTNVKYITLSSSMMHEHTLKVTQSHLNSRNPTLR